MLLKEQTHRGKLVVVNIHQPSSEIYKLFDRLWLLDRGGYPIYDGNPIEAIIYFKQAAKYTDPDISVCSTCGNVNSEYYRLEEDRRLRKPDEHPEVYT